MASLLEAAEEVARLAGTTALRHFRPGVAVDTKADGSPVTIADRSAEATARRWIEAHFPDDGILGEEFGLVREGAARRWMLDPVDGTKTFIRGVPLWGSLVSITEGDAVLAAAAFYPAVAEMLAAAPGEGCWWNGVRCSVSAVSSIAQATVVTTDEQFPRSASQRAAWRRLASRAALSRSWGDCYGYLLVATGRAEVMVDGVLGVWDATPFLPIIEEAGGAFTDWYGARTASAGSAVATNRALAEGARDILNALDHERTEEQHV